MERLVELSEILGSGFNGLYISNLGNLVSNRNGNTITMKTKISNKGYATASLWNTETKNHKDVIVHILVAMAFVPNPDNLPQVNHIDEDKSHNYDTNLEWCTCEHNIQHSRGHGAILLKDGVQVGGVHKSIRSACKFAEDNYGCNAGSLRTYGKNNGYEVQKFNGETVGFHTNSRSKSNAYWNKKISGGK